MKRKILLSLTLAFLSIVAVKALSSNETPPKSIYDFKVETIDGDEFDFATLKGKKVMIVNVASKCGFTYQYEQLQKLYSDYKDKGFVIIGFPANNFGNQESGSNEEIATFCSATYGVDFPMMAKISAKGDDMAPIYKWLTSKKLNKVGDFDVQWNFNKFLINEDGTLETRMLSKVEPGDASIIEWIEE